MQFRAASWRSRKRLRNPSREGEPPCTSALGQARWGARAPCELQWMPTFIACLPRRTLPEQSCSLRRSCCYSFDCFIETCRRFLPSLRIPLPSHLPGCQCKPST
ncbi:hypothetical protein Y1Q_0021143 [Alligator mississippiensis]|uniref:Uncharacterized protein n=1 Tax=Alligator mississippiensis TaxID=8496 RepID=A0A151NCN3_ALLMI|nr:hypothetical protein Y1Q_0021143 [Alligator mississippiensis]